MEIPEELTVPNPTWPDARELARELAKQLSGRSQAELADAKIIVEVISPTLGKPIVNLANNVWRLRAKLVDPISNEIKEDITKDDVKKMARYLDAMYAVLGEIGIEIKDRTGETFDYGLPEKVVTAQPQEGLSSERIIETVRPTIYWNEKIAQQGEVIIATPITPSDSEKYT
jgi:hypothetical protein